MSTETPTPTVASSATALAPAAAPAGDSTANAPAAPSGVETLYPKMAPSSDGAATSPESVSSEAEEPSAPAAEGADSEAEAGEPVPVSAKDYGEFTLPDGWERDTELETAAKAAFAEAGVPADKAQSLMDLYTSTIERAQSAAQKEFDKQQTAWKREIDSLPDFKGATRETTLTAIGSLFDTYGTPGLRELMANPAIGNNPEVLRFLASTAKALSEGAPASPGRPAHNQTNGRAGKPSPLDVLYSNSPS